MNEQANVKQQPEEHAKPKAKPEANLRVKTNVTAGTDIRVPVPHMVK